MKVKDIHVTNERGQTKPAQLVVCPECDGEEFRLYFIDKDRVPHIQCAGCAEVFCDGEEKGCGH